MLTAFERGLVVHLLVDWLLQNDWMARNKVKLTHPAIWVHAGLHAGFLGVALGWPGGLALGIVHLLIDTRVPLRLWRRIFGQTTVGPTAMHTLIWADQALHILSIALWVSLAAR